MAPPPGPARPPLRRGHSARRAPCRTLRPPPLTREPPRAAAATAGERTRRAPRNASCPHARRRRRRRRPGAAGFAAAPLPELAPATGSGRAAWPLGSVVPPASLRACVGARCDVTLRAAVPARPASPAGLGVSRGEGGRGRGAGCAASSRGAGETPGPGLAPSGVGTRGSARPLSLVWSWVDDVRGGGAKK